MAAVAIAVAAAVPVTTTRPQEEAHALFASLPGLELKLKGAEEAASDWRLWASSGLTLSTMNSFSASTQVRGAFTMASTADGSDFGTLYIASAYLDRGDMQVTVLLSDKTNLAEWARQSRPTMVQSGDTALPVRVFGQPHGQMETSTWGMKPKYADLDGSTIRAVSRGCCQPHSYVTCAAFLCFFPTFGIGSCIALFWALPKVPQLFNLKRGPSGAGAGVLSLWAINQGFGPKTKVRVEFAEGLDPKTKLGATLASIFLVAEAFTDNRGGNLGASEMSVMER